MMAFIPRQEPFWVLAAKKLGDLSMNDWAKIALVIAGTAIVTWSAVQQHEYRISKIEDSFESHLLRHEDQSREIQQSLKKIELDLTRLQK